MGIKVLRIAIVRPSTDLCGIGAFYQRAFRCLGHEAICISLVDEHSSFVGHFGRVIADRLWPHRELQSKAVHAVLKTLRDFRPDVLLVSRCERLSSETAQEICAQARVGSALLYTDHPFVIPGSQVTRKSSFFSAFDIVLPFSRALVPVFYQLGAKAVRWLPFAHDPVVHRPVRIDSDEKSVYAANIAYLGTWGPLQEMWLRQMQKLGLKIYGGSWWRAAGKGQLATCWLKGLGIGEDMCRAIGGSKIVFNLVRAEHGAFHSMKTFEIPACGGFMLTNRTDEQELFFQDRSEAVYFDTMEEAIDYAQYYLDHEFERRRIRENGMKAVQRHTYEQRADILLNYFDTGKWCMEI